MKPTKSIMTVLRQTVELIPSYLVSKLARHHGVDKQSRSFSPWSHVVSLVHARLAHSLSLNDVCDDLRSHSGALSTVRGATPPSRNGLSHANRDRNADMAEALFWQVLGDLQTQAPSFGMGRKYVGFPVASNARSTWSIPPRSNWWPTVWTGPNTAGERQRPSVICDRTCRPSCHVLPW